ncbi:MAG: regulator [Bacteroidetes bacterium]|nr:regulator [Bacteroidota bacterium]
MISCSDQTKTPAKKNTSENNCESVVSKTDKTNSPVIPAVIRSAVPHGSYGYEADTLQVSQYIRYIFQDSKGNLWFGTVGDGACRYDGTSLTYFTTREGLSGNNVQSIDEGKDGYLWFGTTGGLSKYDGTTFTNFSEKNGLSKNLVFSVLIDRSEAIWVGTAGGICKYNPAANSWSAPEIIFTSFPIPESAERLQIRNIAEDRNSNIWFGTEGGGAYRYNGKSLMHISEKDGLGNNKVLDILEDKDGNMWFCTYGGGIARFNPAEENRTGVKTVIKFTDKNCFGLNYAVMAMQEKSGTIWVSVRSGVCRFDPSSAVGTASKAFTYLGVKNGLTNGAIQSIFEDSAGNLWFGSGAGLFRLDRSRVDHPCNKNTCKHNLKMGSDRKEHDQELVKTFINVTKKGPWPGQFR